MTDIMIIRDGFREKADAFLEALERHAPGRQLTELSEALEKSAVGIWSANPLDERTLLTVLRLREKRWHVHKDGSWAIDVDSLNCANSCDRRRRVSNVAR